MSVDRRMFRALGPLTVERDGQFCALGGPRQRLVLALLLAGANQVVSRDELIEGVWGETLPGSPRSSLHSYVSNLRKALGEDLIHHTPDGYTIRVGPEEFDALRFEQLIEVAGIVVASDPLSARIYLDDALGMWSGPAFGDLRYASALRMETARLEELRILAEEERFEVRLALGEHRQVIAPLRGFVAEHPLRERFCGHLMLALYRSGRQADALEVFRDLRSRLVDQLGVEPADELWRLEERILQHDPALGVESTPVRVGVDDRVHSYLSERPARAAPTLDQPSRSVLPPPTRQASIPWRGALMTAALTGVIALVLLGRGFVVAENRCVAPPPNLAAWWSGDGTTRDLLGGGEAALVGDASFGPGLVREAFALDGDGDFVDLGRSDLAFGTGDFTVGVWVNFTSLEGEQVLVEKWVQRFEAPSLGWTFTKLEDDAIGFFSEDASGRLQQVVTAPLDLSTDAWIHLAASRRGNRIEIMRDGNVVASLAGDEVTALGGTSALRLGHRGDPTNTPGSEDWSGFYLNGAIDEVVVISGSAVDLDHLNEIVAAREAGVCPAMT